MPEGDSLHRAARRLQALVGERLEIETPHPRAAATGVGQRLDGRTLLAVEAVGKNLFLRFDGDLVLRSHLRMTGRWRVEHRGARRVGTPWLVLRGVEYEAVLWNGPLIALERRPAQRVGPDILADPPDFETMLARLRSVEPAREVGEALLDQRLVAGIGNIWKAESLWHARISPWSPLAELGDESLRNVLREANRLMRAALEGGRSRHAVYRRAGRPCRRCGQPVGARGQGEAARTTYWCDRCQQRRRQP